MVPPGGVSYDDDDGTVVWYHPLALAIYMKNLGHYDNMGILGPPALGGGVVLLYFLLLPTVGLL